MKNNNTKGIKVQSMMRDENGLFKLGEAIVVFACRPDHNVLSVIFGDRMQISLAYINVTKTLQAVKNSAAMGRVDSNGYAVEKTSALGTLTYKDSKISEEGTVAVTVTSKGNDQRLLLSFEDKVEIMVELDPILLLADEAKGSRLMS